MISTKPWSRQICRPNQYIKARTVTQKDTRNPENWIYRQFIDQDVGKLNLGEPGFWAKESIGVYQYRIRS